MEQCFSADLARDQPAGDDSRVALRCPIHLRLGSFFVLYFYIVFFLYTFFTSLILLFLQADVFLVLWFKDNATKPMYR